MTELSDNSYATSSFNVNTCRDANQESVSLIYFSPSISTNNESAELIKQLRTVVNFVCQFNDIDACNTYVRSVKKEKVVIVVFGLVNVPRILSDFGNLRQVDSVLALRVTGESQSVYDHEKFLGSFECFDDLLPELRTNVELIEKHLNTFNFFRQHQRSTRNLSSEAAEYLWFQLFKDIIMKLPHDEDAKCRMIKACRFYYHDNKKQLILIDEFNRHYRPDEAIQWYTRSSFVYKLVNKALRTEDIDQLDVFRFFIRDLRICLAREHKFIREFEDKLLLYRGATLSISELEIFTQNPKTLISTNGFWSTSRSRRVAEMFVGKSKNRNDTVPVLFEIECDVDLLGTAVVLADVSYLSKMKDEDEIIFDLGATFCIDDIVHPSEHTASSTIIIKIHATTEGYEIAREYINENRINMMTTSVRVIFGKLLMDMGEYDKALRYFQQLVQEPDFDDLVWAHINLGSVYQGLGRYLDAKAQYAIAYDLCIATEPLSYRDAASIIDNLGVIWDDMGRLDEALDCHKFAYKIRMEFLGPNHNDTASSLMNIGAVYYAKNYYENSLNCYLRALEIMQDWLPLNHPDTAHILANIGLVYLRICDYEGALDYLQQALVMQEQCLPAIHSSVANTLNNLGSVYYELKDYEKSLSCYSKSLEMKKACFSSDHTNIADVLDNIGSIHLKKHEYDQAAEVKLRALHIRQSLLPDNHPDIAASLSNISRTYFGKQEYDKALEYAKKALLIKQNGKNVDLISIGQNLILIGNIFLRQKHYDQSLEYYLKALENHKKCVPVDHQSIADNLYCIGCVYERLNNMSQALDYYVEALTIFNESSLLEHPTRNVIQRSIVRIKLLTNRTDDAKISRSASDAQNALKVNSALNRSRRKSFS